MKFKCFFVMIVSLLFCAMMMEAIAENEYYWVPPTGMARGFVNVVTAPGELIRAFWYYTQLQFKDHPYLLGLDGFLIGIVGGTFLTVTRVTTGVLGVFDGGLGNSSFNDAFPTFFWEGAWNPE